MCGWFDWRAFRGFASVSLLFKNGDEFIWKQHSFARKAFLRAFKSRLLGRQRFVYDCGRSSIDPQLLVAKLEEWVSFIRLSLYVQMV